MKLGPYALDIIHCGECSEMLAALPDDYIDLTVTSPPYDDLREYQGYTFDFPAIAAQLWRVTKKGGVVVWVVGDQTKDGSESGTSFRQALGFMGLGFRLHDTMIYHRDCPPMNDNRYQHEFEYMFILSSGRAKTFNPIRIPKVYVDKRKSKKYHRHANGTHIVNNRKDTTDKVKGNIWRIDGGGSKSTKDQNAFKHPAIFPEALARDHIISWSNPGDVVLDPMVGSGTTAKMAKQLDRHWLGFDISQEYVDLARERVKNTQRPLPNLVQAIETKPEQGKLNL